LYDLALEQYFAQIALEDEEDKHRPRHRAAICAWHAAGEAVTQRDYRRAAVALDIMRDQGGTWVKEQGQAKGALARACRRSRLVGIRWP
jgi:hypothetical protein